jgi:hypothetical protein
MRQVWNVLLDLADGAVLLAHVSGPIAAGFNPRATVRNVPRERATFMGSSKLTMKPRRSLPSKCFGDAISSMASCRDLATTEL